jgi:hypothetical protein
LKLSIAKNIKFALDSVRNGLYSQSGLRATQPAAIWFLSCSIKDDCWRRGIDQNTDRFRPPRLTIEPKKADSMKANSSHWLISVRLTTLIAIALLLTVSGAVVISSLYGKNHAFIVLSEKNAVPDTFGVTESPNDMVAWAWPDYNLEDNSSVHYTTYFQSQGYSDFPVPPVYPPSVGSDVDVQSGLRRRNEQGISAASPQSSGAQIQNQWATGLPYVTPAPNSLANPGRYPTSPYSGPRLATPYQNASFQGTILSPGAVAVSSPSQATLPQYQMASCQTAPYPCPGIYPTNFQQGQVLPPPSLPPDGLQGQTYIPPTLTPNWNPNMYAADNAGHKPLFTLGQENYNVVMGRGIIGQPKAYVPGQCVRNFFRYLTP